MQNYIVSFGLSNVASRPVVEKALQGADDWLSDAFPAQSSYITSLKAAARAFRNSGDVLIEPVKDLPAVAISRRKLKGERLDYGHGITVTVDKSGVVTSKSVGPHDAQLDEAAELLIEQYRKHRDEEAADKVRAWVARLITSTLKGLTLVPNQRLYSVSEEHMARLFQLRDFASPLGVKVYRFALDKGDQRSEQDVHEAQASGLQGLYAKTVAGLDEYLEDCGNRKKPGAGLVSQARALEDVEARVKLFGRALGSAQDELDEKLSKARKQLELEFESKTQRSAGDVLQASADAAAKRAEKKAQEKSAAPQVEDTTEASSLL